MKRLNAGAADNFFPLRRRPGPAHSGYTVYNICARADIPILLVLLYTTDPNKQLTMGFERDKN